MLEPQGAISHSKDKEGGGCQVRRNEPGCRPELIELNLR